MSRDVAKQKRRLGARIVAGLTEFRDVLRSGEPIENRFTVRTVELDLQPQSYDAKSVRATRAALGVSQAVFAHVLGVSVELVESWEQGARKPKPIACRLLDEINRNRDYWLKKLRGSVKQPVSR